MLDTRVEPMRARDRYRMGYPDPLSRLLQIYRAVVDSRLAPYFGLRFNALDVAPFRKHYRDCGEASCGSQPRRTTAQRPLVKTIRLRAGLL